MFHLVLEDQQQESISDSSLSEAMTFQTKRGVGSTWWPPLWAGSVTHAGNFPANSSSAAPHRAAILSPVFTRNSCYSLFVTMAVVFTKCQGKKTDFNFVTLYNRTKYATEKCWNNMYLIPNIFVFIFVILHLGWPTNPSC